MQVLKGSNPPVTYYWNGKEWSIKQNSPKEVQK